MAKLLILIAVGLYSVVAEPPVNTYLPTAQSGHGGQGLESPSSQYGSSGAFSGQPSSSYGEPSSSFGGQSYHNGASSPKFSSEFDVQSGQLPFSSYGAPNSGINGVPVLQYGAPAPDKISRQNRLLSSQYGAPIESSNTVGSASGGYGQTGYAEGGAESFDDQSEPAKYEFNYEVNAPEYAVEFGREESRDGDNTRGSYQVLLPDGRKQLVQYIADKDGFKPIISYERAAKDEYAGASGPSGSYGSPSAGGYSGGYSGSVSGYSAPSADGYSAKSTASYTRKPQDSKLSGSGPY